VPYDEFAEAGVRRGQSVLIVASAVSVAAVVAIVALVVHPWRDTAAHSPAPGVSALASSLDSPLASPASSVPAVSASVPAYSAAPASPSTVISGSFSAPSTTPPVPRRAAPTAPAVAEDSQPNFKVSVHASPSQVVVGQHVRLTVTIVNAGGVFDRSVVMWFGGSDPSDNFSDASPPCTDSSLSISCPITGVRPGRTWSFTVTFIPGPFPAMGHFDDAVSVAFNYTDSHGDPQESPQYYGHVLLLDAPASSPPASGAPSNPPTPSAASTAPDGKSPDT
jgi:hypothetical protein